MIQTVWRQKQRQPHAEHKRIHASLRRCQKLCSILAILLLQTKNAYTLCDVIRIFCREEKNARRDISDERKEYGFAV